MAIVNKGLEMARMLAGVSEICLDMDVKGESDSVRYGEEDVINALTIFMHVCNNVSIHRFNDKKMDIKDSLPEHSKHAVQLRNWVRRATGFDPRTYFHKKHE